MRNYQSSIPLLALFLLTAPAQSQEETRQPTAQLVYTDVEHFLAAYARLEPGVDTVAILETEYLAKGTPGLKEYASRFGVTAVKLADAVRRHPRFFASLADLPDRLRAEEARVKSALGKLAELTGAERYPPVYYVVGGLSSGGQASQAGVLVAVDVFALGEDGHRFEIDEGRRVYPTSHLSYIVTHEMTHILQVMAQGMDQYRSIYGENASVLANAIREGSADFFAEMASGGVSAPEARDYLRDHGDEIWPVFQEQKNDVEFGIWFYYRPESQPDWPADLGYAIGAQITRAFFDRAEDKREAARVILGVTDYEEFWLTANVSDD